MTTKNNLSAFKRPPSRSVLTKPVEPAPQETTKRVGKPPKPAAEKFTKRAQVMFTEAEFASLTVKRGAVPLSVYLRNLLKETGEL